ncbi:MAG TPA: hypothetical protein PKW50_08250 [Syntrophomonas sp.]|nr:hypothetical protein [Syntrophomonas sp.]HPT70125.1 hypothetical protein [Syntrophomonas sp.]
MQIPMNFQLNFIKQEQHLMLPRTSSIVLTQNLYDILFQYVITPEKEAKLDNFIKILENHIKSKAVAPFSLPVSELEFLEEGLEELKLLNWAEIPVTVFQVNLDACLNKESYEDEIEKIVNLLETMMIVRRYSGSDLVYVYPSSLVRY